MEITAVLEGLLFVAGEEGLEKSQLLDVMQVNEAQLDEAVELLQRRCREEGRGIQLLEVAEGFQLTTLPEHADYFRRLVHSPASGTLSQASLETLAVIAYKQPVSRMEIEDIRGVRTDRPIRTLHAKGLIEESGRKEGAGRAILYRTTRHFLEQFGLKSLEELPPLPEGTDPEEEAEEFDLFFQRFREAAED
ncbi:SMC-Scp complex subunit ScpB [Alkalicoccus urumqiensis]|uniref:Segregation and condensation protein B n=2 Tax=Alkalicoccus urumqiensis TaxID=1548213 RepID=A0A2P6ML17_ALKUR|nr:SMC-Scp complex subunit ScpB [Alkalicoccus urumqiensis]